MVYTPRYSFVIIKGKIFIVYRNSNGQIVSKNKIESDRFFEI